MNGSPESMSESWPDFERQIEEEVIIGIQVNGKLEPLLSKDDTSEARSGGCLATRACQMAQWGASKVCCGRGKIVNSCV